MKKAVKEIPPYLPKRLTTPKFLEWLRVFTTEKFPIRDTETDIVGAARIASEEKGRKILNMMVCALVETIKPRQTSLDWQSSQFSDSSEA